MKFYSTRNPRKSYNIRQAISEGQAAEGGLFIPEILPAIGLDRNSSLPEVALQVLWPFLADQFKLQELENLVKRAFDFPAPIKCLGDFDVLELFHGPTAAFKDFGARFLAQIMQAFEVKGTILVATSGDTGGAVASAFYQINGIKVVVLFPQNGVSPLQEKQLTCWGENIISLKVQGDFDDCQRLVKECFADAKLKQAHALTSANSINIGRLLPQMVYYFWASQFYAQKNIVNPRCFIPTGNMGNSLAALWARSCGANLGEIILCTNANPTLAEYFSTGTLTQHKSIKTLANAMDVALPSNLERFTGMAQDHKNLTESLRVDKISDSEIKAAINQCYQQQKYILCPHTATAYASWSKSAIMPPSRPASLLVSTAHPAKFAEVVEPLIGQKISLPQSLEKLLKLPSHGQVTAPTKSAVVALLQQYTK